jgi:hypothetical protein
MGKEQEELDNLQVKIKELEESLAKEEGNRKELETQVAKLVEEKNAVSRNKIIKYNAFAHTFHIFFHFFSFIFFPSNGKSILTPFFIFLFCFYVWQRHFFLLHINNIY